jgi:hypothetical protein
MCHWASTGKPASVLQMEDTTTHRLEIEETGTSGRRCSPGGFFCLLKLRCVLFWRTSLCCFTSSLLSQLDSISVLVGSRCLAGQLSQLFLQFLVSSDMLAHIFSSLS